MWVEITRTKHGWTKRQGTVHICITSVSPSPSDDRQSLPASQVMKEAWDERGGDMVRPGTRGRLKENALLEKEIGEYNDR